MDSGVPAIAPGIVLAATLLLLAVLGALSLVDRARSRGPHAARPGDPPARGSARPQPQPPTAGFPDDDLPRFRAHPPGSAPATGPATALATVALAAAGEATALHAPPAPPAPRADRPAGGGGATRRAARRPVPASMRLLLAFAVAALLLIAALAAVALAGAASTAGPAAAGATGPAPSPSPSPAPVGMTAELSFGGMVLDRYAVGIAVGYPSVELGVRDGGGREHLRFARFDCFGSAPPADPVAAGCVGLPDAYADLATPDLLVRRRGADLVTTGRFATYTGTGGAPTPTGRAYALTLSLPVPQGPAAAPRDVVAVLVPGDAPSPALSGSGVATPAPGN